jgi:hypothetical protein
MRSTVRVQVQGEITAKGGKDQGAMMDHPWGQRHKVRTSCEKTPYLDRRDDDSKMTQLKGFKSKMSRWAAGRKTGLNRARKGQAGWTMPTDPCLFPRFAIPFDLALPRTICSSCIWRPPYPIILPTPIHQKTATTRWGRELDEFVIRINTGGGKEARGGLQAVGLGVFPSFIATIFVDNVLQRFHHPYVL